MIAIPVDAQTRGGNLSRGGSGGGNARNNGGSRPSSSMSSQSRNSGQSGNTKGLSSVPRSTQPAHTPSQQQPKAQPQQPPQRSQSQQRTEPQRSRPQRTQPNAQPQQPPQRSQSQQRTEPQRTQPKAQPQQPPKEQPRATQPPRGGNNVQRQEPRPENRQRPDRPGENINRNQRQPGMSAHPDAPRTVRQRPGNSPRNFEGGREPHNIKMRPGPGHDIERIPPRRRDPLPYGRAVRFWDGGRHYFGYRVSYLPGRYTRVVYAGTPYYLLDGIYYRYYRGYYYICRPPFGIVVNDILEDILYTAINFSYYYDVANTYRTIDENAKTIASQNATIAANNATIARQNADIALNSELAAKSFQEANRLGLVQSYADAGVEYFYQDGVFFIKGADGKYVTIVPPAGALVDELPDDYDTITLDGVEYYKVDDTVYKLTIIDGSPYFEVLGQMTGSMAQKYDMYESL